MSSFGPTDDDLDPGAARDEALAAAQAWEEQEKLLALARADTVEARAQRAAAVEEMTLADEISQLMRKRTLADLEAAKKPHPHLFSLGDSGCFPRNEAGVIGGPGREGKTGAIIAVAVAGALGHDLGNQPVESFGHTKGFSTVIFSAEDSVEQYDRKLGSQLAKLKRSDQLKVLDRVRIVDLDRIKARVGGLVIAPMGQVQQNVALVDAMIDACVRPPDGNAIDGEWDAPLGLVVGETLSTLSDAAEDNPGVRAMAEAGKRIARELGVHWLTAHHTSQLASANLPTLNISSNDIRGGRALIDNTRQTWFLVNLGNEEDPFPDKDARTALRKMIAPGRRERISALICLDSSKSIDPPPLFFAWDGTRQEPVEPPSAYRGMQWRRLHRELGNAKAELAADEKEQRKDVEMRRCVSLVAAIHEEGAHPTARAVSQRAGRSDSWAGPYLTKAWQLGLVRASDELNVPRTKGPTRVYRPLEGDV